MTFIVVLGNVSLAVETLIKQLTVAMMVSCVVRFIGPINGDELRFAFTTFYPYFADIDLKQCI